MTATIVTIGGEKGGTGKTTISTQLAAVEAFNGSDVLLINTDPQQTAVHWSALREAMRAGDRPDLKRVSCVSLFGPTLVQELISLRDRYGVIIVDAGGRDSVEFRASLVVANKLVVPLRASPADTWTLAKIDEIVAQARAMNPALSASVVLSMILSASKDRAKAKMETVVADYPAFWLLRTVVATRENYVGCMGAGMGAHELKGSDRDAKAVTEVLSLRGEIFDHG
ncbi:MAG: AAA family ATPase [Alphaproteobacteria bacterium]|nr:AAA family ATPase [Alphaproteobacteria bacterium]